MDLDGNPSVMIEWPRLCPDATRSGGPWAGFPDGVSCCNHLVTPLGSVSPPRGHCAREDVVRYSFQDSWRRIGMALERLFKCLP